MELQQNAIYGTSVAAYNQLGANMVNPMQANGDTDWGAILANGIRGAAQGAIAAQVNGAYASGQLVAPYTPTYNTTSAGGLNGLILLAALAFFVLKAD